MSPTELNQAIIGGQYRESRELRLPRMIAFMIGKYLGFFSKALKIEKFYPLMFDVQPKAKETDKAWELAKKKWERIDKEKSKT